VRREGLKNLMLTELAPANEGTKDMRNPGHGGQHSELKADSIPE
jgi:hypothetical protein